MNEKWGKSNFYQTYSIFIILTISNDLIAQDSRED